MKCNPKQAIERVIKKAATSSCRFKIAAIGFDYRGKVIGIKCNSPRFKGKGRGVHAERELMRSSPKSLKTILIVRIGSGGDIRPIHACEACQDKANDLGISIKTIGE